MRPSRFLAQVAVSFVLAQRANAESHVIKFINNCGYGYPALIYGGNNILPTGTDTYTSGSPWSGIAYLQTGVCGANGEQCTLLETTLINPTCAGCGSSTDISLIAPHQYSVETSFAYYGGCDGQGQTCTNANCVDAAFFNPNDNFVQVACETNDVNLLVSFCANATELVLGGISGSSPPSTTPSSVPPTSGGSSPTSSLPTPSSIPSSGSSTPGSVTPGTSPTPTPTPSTTPSPTDTNVSDPGCDETGYTTPSSTPTPSTVPTDTNVSDPGCEETGYTAPSSTPTNVSVPPTGQTTPPTSTPTHTPTSTPTPTPTPTPTTSPRCRPRTTSLGLSPSNSPPTSPAITPTLAPTFPPASGTPMSMSVPQRRRHRRIANRKHD